MSIQLDILKESIQISIYIKTNLKFKNKKRVAMSHI